MVFVKYSCPLPNDGDRYSLSEQELVELLDAAYDNGFKHGVQIATPVETTASSSSNITIFKRCEVKYELS